MEDTLVMEPETSTVEEAAPLEAETVADPPEQETEADAAEAEPLSREEHERLLQEAISAVKAEQEQAAREAADRNAVNEHKTQMQAWEKWGREQAHPFLENLARWAHKEGEEGRDLRLNPKVIENLETQLGAYIVTAQFGRFDQTVEQAIKERYGADSVAADVWKKRDIATATGDLKTAVHALLDIAEEGMLPKVTTRAEKTLAEKAKSAQETQKLKQQDAAARASGIPTRGATSAAGKRWYIDTLEALPSSEKSRMAREGTLEAAIAEARKNGMSRRG